MHSVAASVAVIFLVGSFSGLAADSEERNPILVYHLSEMSGPFLKDTSGAKPPIHLRISELNRMRRVENGIRITGNPGILAAGNASRLVKAIQDSGELSLEVWLRPANLNQSGPARIVTFSQNGSQRNFTLGQEGEKLDFRLRTTETSSNGLPSLAMDKPLDKASLLHVVITRNASGHAQIHVNGELAGERTIMGDFSNWNGNYKIGLGDEITGGRAWKGTLYQVMLFDHSLKPSEIQSRFKSGYLKAEPESNSRITKNEKELFFESRVAPLLSKHCLECHDASNSKGDLDLSRRAPAFAGGKNGDTIIPFKADDSELFLTVLHDEMPDERTPLNDKEKAVLKKWINDGAVWSLDFIDSALYAHGREGGVEVVRRLTIQEYIDSVKFITGVDIEKEAREMLPPDLRADGFSNTAYNLNVDLKHVETYAELASIIISKMDVGKFARKFTNNIGFTDGQMGQLLNRMGKFVLRGPILENELFLYRGISTTVAGAGGEYEDAIGYILEAMLQSPRFLYRIEEQIGDGTRWPVDEYELASRLSFLVWGTAPDDQLINAAESGDLLDRQGILNEVDRLLKDPQAIDRSLQFLSEWMNLGRLANMNPNPDHFPKWNPELAADMRIETLSYFKDIAWERQRPLHEIFNAPHTYITPRLARHYGLPEEMIPDGVELAEFFRVSLPKSTGRSGIFTHGSLLTVGGDEASMVARGLFLMQEFLRGVVNDPPPCVDTTPVPTKAGLTQRNIAQERIENKSCGGCHSRFEPLAFGLEKFDGLGSFHEEDEFGNPLREDGEVLVPGTAKPVTYTKSHQLSDILAASERVRQTIVWKASQFAIGRPLNAFDGPLLESIYEDWQKMGGTYQALISAIAVSDLINTKLTEEE